MAKYIKVKASVSLGQLKFDVLKDKEKLNTCLSYSYTTPRNFYLWCIKRNMIYFFKRPLNVQETSLIFKCYVVFEDRQKAKKIAANMTPQILRRIFKQNLTIFL